MIAPTQSLLVSAHELEIFNESYAIDPAFNAAREQLADQLAWLHERLYPEIRKRRWDLHIDHIPARRPPDSPIIPRFLISPVQVTLSTPRIDSIRLRYSKAETVQRLMQKYAPGDLTAWDSLCMLNVRVDGRGLSIEVALPANARADADNLYHKLVFGPSEKMTLRQLFADLGGAYLLELIVQGEARLRVHCSRLVNLGVLNATIEKFVPGIHDLRVAYHFAPDDPTLRANVVVEEILRRIEPLYALYQYCAWAPRNNFLARPQSNAKPSINPSL